MHLDHQLRDSFQPLNRLVSTFLDQQQDFLKDDEVSLLAPTSRRMLLEERDNPLHQFHSIAHFKPETEAMIGSAITLDVNPTAPEELLQVVEQRPIVCPEFETESRLDPRSTPLGAIQMDGKASFAINKTYHIVSSQHQVSPFRHWASVLLWDQLTSFHVIRVPAVEGSPWVTYQAVSHIPERAVRHSCWSPASSPWYTHGSTRPVICSGLWFGSDPPDGGYPYRPVRTLLIPFALASLLDGVDLHHLV
jgi:hypothetical protein